MMIRDRWAAIQGFGLGDTDDNMRMMQVRALLDGQGWSDLRQYRLNPPAGRRHSLVAARRPADRRASSCCSRPCSAADCGAGRGDGRAAAGDAGRHGCARRDGAAAGRPQGASPSHRRCWPMRRLHARHVGAAAHRPSWLAAGDARRGGGRPDRSQAARGGVLLGVATALSLAIGLEMLLYLAVPGRDGPALDHRPRGSAAAVRLRRQPRRRLRARLPPLRFRGQPRAGLRRACRRSGCRRWSPAGRSRWAPPAEPRQRSHAAAGARACRRALAAAFALVLARLRRPARALPRPSSSGFGSTRSARRCRSGATAPASPP